MNSPLPSRYWFFVIVVLALGIGIALWGDGWGWRWMAVVGGALTVIGLWDMTQKRKTLRRNFPILAHGRYFFEAIRPMMRQYVVEADDDEVPFSHDQRSIVYQRAKLALETRPFGTERNVYANNYEWINHSMMPSLIDGHDFRVPVGGPQCTQPYLSLIHI